MCLGWTIDVARSCCPSCGTDCGSASASASASSVSGERGKAQPPILKTTAFAPTKSNRCTVRLRTLSTVLSLSSSSGVVRHDHTGNASGGGCANWQLSPCRHAPLRCQCRQTGFSFGAAISTARRSQPCCPECATALLRILSERYCTKSSVLVTVLPLGQSAQSGLRCAQGSRRCGASSGKTQQGTTATGRQYSNPASTIGSVAWSGCIPTIASAPSSSARSRAINAASNHSCQCSSGS